MWWAGGRAAAFGMTEPRPFRHFRTRPEISHETVRLMRAPAGAKEPESPGNPGEFTIKEPAQLVLEKTGVTSKWRFVDLPKGDPDRRRPDITHAGELPGWQPRYALGEGPDRTIAYFRNEISTAVGMMSELDS